jgi:NTE family protein
MHKKDSPRSPERNHTDVALALQGGGAAGAFTWGVLDSVLDRGVQIEAISGASAGAVNAVLVADGLIDGGPDRAREKLAGFWRKASDLMPPGSTSATLASIPCATCFATPSTLPVCGAKVRWACSFPRRACAMA